MIDLSKLNRRFYFFDEDENRQLIDIFKNDFVLEPIFPNKENKDIN